MTRIVASNFHREQVITLLDGLKKTVLEELDRDGLVEISIQDRTRDVTESPDYGTVLVDKILTGRKWSIEIPPPRERP